MAKKELIEKIQEMYKAVSDDFKNDDFTGKAPAEDLEKMSNNDLDFHLTSLEIAIDAMKASKNVIAPPTAPAKQPESPKTPAPPTGPARPSAGPKTAPLPVRNPIIGWPGETQLIVENIGAITTVTMVSGISVTLKPKDKKSMALEVARKFFSNVKLYAHHNAK